MRYAPATFPAVMPQAVGKLRDVLRVGLSRIPPPAKGVCADWETHVVVTEALEHFRRIATSPTDRRLASQMAARLRDTPPPAFAITPILLPVGPDIRLEALIDRWSPVSFDFSGQGVPIRAGWITDRAAWLVWDPEQRKRFVREARLGLAASFEGRRDFTNAKEHLMAVLTDDPKNGPARTRLGSATFLMNKPDEALVEFQTAYRDDPASELPELQMAALYNSQNADEKAEEWFKKAVTTYATNPKSHRAYAAWLIDHSRAASDEPRSGR